MLGEGAVREHPRGTICDVRPIKLEDDQVVGNLRQAELSTDFESLRRRLKAATEQGDDRHPPEEHARDNR